MSVPALAEFFRIRKQRVMAILALQVPPRLARAQFALLHFPGRATSNKM